MCNVGEIKTKRVRKLVTETKSVKKRVRVRVWSYKWVNKKEKKMRVVNVPQAIKTIKPEKAKIGYRFMYYKYDPASKQIYMLPLNTSFQNPWKVNPTRADVSPTTTNKKGLYIFTTLDEALRQNHPQQGMVLCKVKYWGKVAEHKLGVRAQHAEVLEIRTLEVNQSIQVFDPDVIHPVLGTKGHYVEINLRDSFKKQPGFKNVLVGQFIKQ